jgi:hypothetical protein
MIFHAFKVSATQQNWIYEIFNVVWTVTPMAW